MGKERKKKMLYPRMALSIHYYMIVDSYYYH